MSVKYEDLSDAYWTTWEAMNVEHDEWKVPWHNQVFCKILEHCGWTIDQWNAVVDQRVRVKTK